MSSIEDQIIRGLLQHMITAAHAEVPGIPDHTRELLACMSPIETERFLGMSRDAVRIDWDAMTRNIRQIRHTSLMVDLARAGASPGLLRELFGLTGSRLTRMREDADAVRPSRRRLNETEESQVVRRHRRNPIPAGRSLARAAWCLDTTREFHLPYMPVHQYSLKLAP